MSQTRVPPVSKPMNNLFSTLRVNTDQYLVHSPVQLFKSQHPYRVNCNSPITYRVPAIHVVKARRVGRGEQG